MADTPSKKVGFILFSPFFLILWPFATLYEWVNNPAEDAKPNRLRDFLRSVSDFMDSLPRDNPGGPPPGPY